MITRTSRTGFRALALGAVVVFGVGCSASVDPDPKYSDLSRKVHEVVVRTQGDASKMTAADRKTMQDAKGYRILVPPGY